MTHPLMQIYKGYSVKKTGLVCFMDVYGYGAASRKNPVQSAAATIGLWESCCTRIDEADRSFDRLAFSDSLVIARECADAEEAFSALEGDLIPMITTLQLLAIAKKILLRGSISLGEYVISNNVVGGEALLRAHENEKRISIPLVHIPLAEAERISSKCAELLENNFAEVPSLNGLVRTLLIYPRPIDPYVHLVTEKLSEAFLLDKYSVANTLRKCLDALHHLR